MTPDADARDKAQHAMARHLVRDALNELVNSDDWPLNRANDPLRAMLCEDYCELTPDDVNDLERRIEEVLPDDLATGWTKLIDHHHCHMAAVNEEAGFLMGLYLGRGGVR